MVYDYTIEREQVVTITARALTDDSAGNPLDVVLAVHDAGQNRIAYDDDSAAMLGGFAETDAAVQGLRLMPGAYTVHVNTFNGAQQGDISLELEIERE